MTTDSYSFIKAKAIHSTKNSYRLNKAYPHYDIHLAMLWITFAVAYLMCDL